MNVWYHLSTIFNQRRILRIVGILTLCVAFITMLFFGISANAAPGINPTISFQGRLLSTGGTPVPDGSYNVQFKIYEGGTGTAVGNPGGELVWTETHINNGGTSGVKVKNGYMTVNLGSIESLESVDFNQDTIWLSMNIAGLATGCTSFNGNNCEADGEMVPMKRLTSSPYAMNAGKLGGKAADEFLQLGNSAQTGDFNITGTGQANVLQGNASVVAPLFDRANAGALAIGTTNATSIQIGSSTANQTITIGTGSGDNLLTLGSTTGSSATVIQGGSGGVSVNTAGPFTIYDDNATQLLAVATDGSLTTRGDVTTNGDIVSLSENGSQSAGISWNGGNSAAYITSSTDTITLQGSGVNLLTAVNSNGEARIGIGNAATSNYALDVTGSSNVSATYAINGVDVLDNSSLTFGGTAVSTISAAENQVLQLNSDTGVRIGDSAAAGEPTLLTLDRSSTTPVATGDAVLGSMYYDTTLGKVQCYEADGWGACSSSPDKFVTLSPAYSNAVTNGTGIGTMTSDICSDTLNINDASTATPVCGTNETYNFYNWTSTELTAQTKSIYVTYQLPTNFTKFVDGSTSLAGRTDSADASVSYEVFKNTTTGLVACGTAQAVSTGTQTTWQKTTATGTADPADCEFSAGDSLVFKINLSASNSANAYVSTLGFAFKDN